MTISRIKGDPGGAAYYHVMSRTTGKQMLFSRDEKNVFAKRLRRQAAFAGIQVITWCMMDNHFHLLIRVPAREALLADVMKDDRKLFWKNLRSLYSRSHVTRLRKDVEQMEKAGEGKRHQADMLVERYTRRMANLSIFMQELKFSFSAWFNRKHGREGTLWMARFKSVLLEGDASVVNKVSAYIDLNPIRAGLVKDPARYRWSGYGQAEAGDSEARKGLSLVYGHTRNAWKQIGPGYRSLLYMEGLEKRDTTGKVIRAGVSEEDFHRVIAEKGKQRISKRLAKRVRYFTEGAAVGGREFLEKVFKEHRAMFGPKRKVGPKKFRGTSWKGSNLFSLRDVV